MTIRSFLSAISLITLTACGGGSMAATDLEYVCEITIEATGEPVWYWCDKRDYDFSHNSPAPTGYYVRSFYDASNSEHLNKGRAYIKDGLVYAHGTNDKLGTVEGYSLLTEIAYGVYKSE